MNTAESTNVASPESMPEKLNEMLFMRGVSRQKRRKWSVQQTSYPTKTLPSGFGYRSAQEEASPCREL